MSAGIRAERCRLRAVATKLRTATDGVEQQGLQEL